MISVARDIARAAVSASVAAVARLSVLTLGKSVMGGEIEHIGQVRLVIEVTQRRYRVVERWRQVAFRQPELGQNAESG